MRTLGSGWFSLRVAPICMVLATTVGAASAAKGQQAQAAQDAAAGSPQFAVASVKPAKRDNLGYEWRYTPDGVSLRGVPMLAILCAAFNVEDDRVVGLSNGMKDQRFDIEAKVDAADAPKLKDMNYHQRYAMLIPLLTDRFKLKFHHETRVLPVFDLVVAKGGPKLTAVTPGAKGNGWSMSDGHLVATATTMESLSNVLTDQMGHTVIDKTGLTGHYDFKLRWTPDDAPPMTGADGTSESTDTSAPPLLTALREQIGLKLESRKEPMDVIVIDQIEEPSPN